MTDVVTICLFPYCNAEGIISIVQYYFAGKHTRKPFARAFLHVCEIHARKLSGEDLVAKIVRMN